MDTTWGDIPRCQWNSNHLIWLYPVSKNNDLSTYLQPISNQGLKLAYTV